VKDHIAFDVFIERVPEAYRVLEAVYGAMALIDIGGLENLFNSWTVKSIRRTLEGFRAIGAEAYAEALSRAMQIFPEWELGGSYARLKSRADVREQLDELDRPLFRLAETADGWLAHLAKYIRDHPSDFGG
jgi:hypothetical protein